MSRKAARVERYRLDPLCDLRRIEARRILGPGIAIKMMRPLRDGSFTFTLIAAAVQIAGMTGRRLFDGSWEVASPGVTRIHIRTEARAAIEYALEEAFDVWVCGGGIDDAAEEER